MSISYLFKPLTINKMALANRIVMAPMTRSHCPNHIPTKEVADYYQRRAAGGTALIITEGTAINHPASHGYPDVPNMYGKDALRGWERVVNQVHESGGKIFPQLWHVGSVRQRAHHENQGVDNPKQCCVCNHPDISGYGPSPVKHPYIKNAEIPIPLTQNDIADLIRAFADAALDAKHIGFDGIELHAAHGYLIDQFFWSVTNKRTDQYGGQTLGERTRFAVEVIQAVREAVGNDFPISFRISQWKLGDYNAKMAENPSALNDFLVPLANAGVDVFHCSTRRFFEAEFPGSPLNLAGWVKKLTGKPTITVGSIGLDNDFISEKMGKKASEKSIHSISILIEKLQAEEFDLVAVGRMLLSDPNWSEKIRIGDFDNIVGFSRQHIENFY